MIVVIAMLAVLVKANIFLPSLQARLVPRAPVITELSGYPTAIGNGVSQHRASAVATPYFANSDAVSDVYNQALTQYPAYPVFLPYWKMYPDQAVSVQFLKVCIF